MQGIRDKCETCKDKPSVQQNCVKCNTICEALNRFYNANIPYRYWGLDLKNENFKGDNVILKTYEELTKNISETYKLGSCVCVVGSHGLGKTMFLTSVLKRFLEKGYTGIYCNLTDIVTNLINGSSEDKAIIRKQLIQADILVIDEFDGRHIADTENSSNLFGRVLEDIFRNRVQNMLPTLLASNSPNPVDTFVGNIKVSLSSLANYIKYVTALGSDYRKIEKSKNIIADTDHEDSDI